MAITQATSYVIASGAVTDAKLAATAVTAQTAATVASADEMLFSDADDAGNLKKTTAQDVANLAPGKVLQVVNTQTGVVATGGAVIPGDNTIPQNTEGNEYMTLAITPTDSANKLMIEVEALLGHSGAVGAFVGALFQDATADAIAAVQMSSAGEANVLTIRHTMVAGTTSVTTFKFRAGETTGATTYFNGGAGSPGGIFGGVAASSITITEIAA